MIHNISSASHLTQVNAAGSNRSASGGTSVAPDIEPQKDELDISPQGSLLERISAGLFGLGSGPVTLEDLRGAYREGAAAFHGSTLAMFKEYGIDSAREAVLTSDFQGKIRLANDHPDKDKIEAAFEENPELANQFRGLSALGSLLRAADEAAPFHEAYAKDPYGAVERYGYLFDDNRQCEFHLRVSDAGIEEFFTES